MYESVGETIILFCLGIGKQYRTIATPLGSRPLVLCKSLEMVRWKTHFKRVLNTMKYFNMLKSPPTSSLKKNENEKELESSNTNLHNLKVIYIYKPSLNF